jgi:hypothetical protein
MFKVKHRKTGQIRTVYGVNGFMFLFYIYGSWEWLPIAGYEPVEEAQ